MFLDFAFEMWIVMVCAPCVLGWLLGEIHGARRARKLFAAKGGRLSLENPIAYAVPSNSEGDGHQACDETLPDGLRRGRAEISTGRLLHDLRAEADRIRLARNSNIQSGGKCAHQTTSFGADEVLDQYERSIEALRSITHRTFDKEMIWIEPDEQLPRFSDAAPLTFEETPNTWPCMRRQLASSSLSTRV